MFCANIDTNSIMATAELCAIVVAFKIYDMGRGRGGGVKKNISFIYRENGSFMIVSGFFFITIPAGYLSTLSLNSTDILRAARAVLSTRSFAIVVSPPFWGCWSYCGPVNPQFCNRSFTNILGLSELLYCSQSFAQAVLSLFWGC
jgi:hypothetical protein